MRTLVLTRISLFADSAKRMVPPEKTPAFSAIELRKKQIEGKKAALAAKNAGVKPLPFLTG